METVMKVFVWIFDNIISQPAILMGTLVFVGYLLMDKKFLDALSGAFKAIIGYMVLQVGSSGMNKGFQPILKGLIQKFNFEGAAVIDSNIGFSAANEAIEAMGQSLSSTMLVLLIGFAVNILLVMFKNITKVRTIYTTGHIMVKQAGFITYLIFYALPEYRNIKGVVLIGVMIGLYWAVFSNLTVEATQNLTGGERVMAVGHSQMLGVWLTDKVADKFGDPEDSVESIELPSSLKAFSDNIFGTSVVMLLMFGGALLAIGPDVMAEIDPTNTELSYAIYIIKTSLSFAVNFLILQTGVKMFVGEITVSFEGISNKLVKGAVPAVDCAATFGFSHGNTVTLGFLFGFLGQLLAIIGLVVFKSPIMIISGFVPLFFDNATIAVFANKRGGRKAAMILPFLSGICQVLLGAVGVSIFGLGKYGGWYGNLDVSTVWLAIGGLLKKFGTYGIIITILVLLLIPQLQYRKNKGNYF